MCVNVWGFVVSFNKTTEDEEEEVDDRASVEMLTRKAIQSCGGCGASIITGDTCD